LNVPSTPVFSSLVSLVTLTQMISLNRDGAGPTPANPPEQSSIETSGESMMNAQAEPRVLAETPSPPELPGLASPDRAQGRGEAVSALVGAETPASVLLDVASLAPHPAAVKPAEAETASEAWMAHLITIGLVVAAFRGRRAIWDLKWRKRLRAKQIRTAESLGQNPESSGKTFKWPLRHGSGHAQPHRIGRLVPRASSMRSTDVR
jgi:hypothetical protein